MGGTLTHAEAKTFYDRFGARQDSQGFYEDRATGELIVHGGFETTRSVFEFGCGTGRVAAQLFAEHLPPEASYRAVDISATMVDLARARLAPWRGRAEVSASSGSMRLDAADAAYDRFLTNFVLDLLSEADIRTLLAEAHRVLLPGGLLCLTGLTRGRRFLSRLVTWVWEAVFARAPKRLGGCRPVELRRYLSAENWELRHHAVVSSFGICSEVVVAARR